MYRKSVPTLAVLLILGGIQHMYAGDNHPVFAQQAELSCAICRQQGNLDGELFVICNDHLVVAHNNCMQARLEAGNVSCPVCDQEFSDQNLHLVLTSLAGDVLPVVVEQEDGLAAQDAELIMQVIAESLRMAQDELAAQALQDELDIQAILIREDQIRRDEELARGFDQGNFNDDPVAQEQPQMQEAPQDDADGHEQEQPAQEQGECSICFEELNNGENVRALGCCRNSFHVNCIDHWLTGNNTCPLCRADVN